MVGKNTILKMVNEMEKKIYCKICENCKKQCDFLQYEIECSIQKGNDVNGEITTWKCVNFEPIYVEERSRSSNDIFFTNPKNIKQVPK